MIDPADLARQFAIQLRSIGEWSRFTTIQRMTVLLGARYNVEPADFHAVLTGELAKECPDELANAEIAIQTSTAGMEFTHPQTKQPHAATGWELFVLKTDGEEW